MALSYFTLKLDSQVLGYTYKMIVFVIEIVAFVLILYILLRRWNPLDELPGPKAYPLIGNVHQLDMKKLFINATDLAKQYGGIYKLRLFTKHVVLVSDERFIHDVLVKQSADFAGRPYSYRSQLLSQGYSIGILDPGPVHTGRRKAVHTHLKQFGSGIKKIEDVTQTATDDLITRFVDQHGRPINAADFVHHCVTDVIAIYLVGETIGEEKLNDIKTMTDGVSKAMGIGTGIFLDWFPFLRFFGNKTYKQIVAAHKFTDTVMHEWFEQRPTEGFINFMQSMSEKEKMASFLDTDIAQLKTAFVFFISGVMTTSSTLSCLINVLCHYPDVQQKIQQEVMDVIGPARHPTLKDQDGMPYLRASILEIGRFASVGPFAPHKAMRTCKLDKYTIPKDTQVWVNLWAMHHDEKLWDEPFTFKPERFLDADGQLVPADHPNRRNIMPFSAGHRVCVGEVFALSRMFLITARILQNFTILPESTLDQQPSCDPRDMKMGLVLTTPSFKVRMTPVSD